MIQDQLRDYIVVSGVNNSLRKKPKKNSLIYV